MVDIEDITLQMIERYCEVCGAPLIFSKSDLPDYPHCVCVACTKCDHRARIFGDRSLQRLIPGYDPNSSAIDQAAERKQVAIKEAARAHHAHVTNEHRQKAEEEARRHYSIWQQGVKYIFDRMSVRAYMPDDIALHLIPVEFHYHEYRDDKSGKLLRSEFAALSMHLTGPTCDDPRYGLSVWQQDATWELWPSSPPTTYWKVHLTHAASMGPSSLRVLNRGGAINQYVNVKTMTLPPASNPTLCLRSGERAEWEVRRFDTTAPLVHARTQIGHTEIAVAAAGPLADDVDIVLASLTRAVPGSQESAGFSQRLLEGREKFRDTREQRFAAERLRGARSGEFII